MIGGESVTSDIIGVLQENGMRAERKKIFQQLDAHFSSQAIELGINKLVAKKYITTDNGHLSIANNAQSIAEQNLHTLRKNLRDQLSVTPQI